jgi:hypothetical protein
MAGFPPHADLRLHASKVREPIVLNGSATPVPVVMRADVPNRLRLINITASNSASTAILLNRFDQMSWKPAAKERPTPPRQQTGEQPARQLVSVGETYDFEIQPSLEQLL